MEARYTIGLDFGSNSMRVLIVDVRTGHELASAVQNYPHGSSGIILDPNQPDLARQRPGDYLTCTEEGLKLALEQAAGDPSGDFSPRHVIGIGVDTTGSTPMPIDRHARSL